LKAIVPVVLVSATVPALTAPVKAVPPELVIVKVLRPIEEVPTVPLTLILPVVFNVRLDKLVVAPPVTELKLIGAAVPVPIVNVLLLTIFVAPKVICPVEVPPTVVLAVTLIGELRLITPVPAADIVPAIFTCEAAVAVIPPVNAFVLVFTAPIVIVPVLPSVVTPEILLLLPVSETLYALAVPVAVKLLAFKFPRKATVSFA
jgi:hypothetical protein